MEELNDIRTTNKNEKPLSIVKTIAEYKKATSDLTSDWNYVKVWSWLIVNTQNNTCKWHCINVWWLPIVCWKLDNCNNFSHATTILLQIKHHEETDAIDWIY